MADRQILTAAVDGWAAVRLEVVRRDRACIFAPLGPLERAGRPANGDPEHFCRDGYDTPIPWHRLSDQAKLRVGEQDHIKEEPMLGAKAPDDTAHLVLTCYLAHHRGLATSHEGRDYSRAWLAHFYPTTWAVFLERRSGL
jgi:hypothetical protein